MAEKVSGQEIQGWVERHSGWVYRDEAIRKRFTFPTFRAAVVFVNRVATIADEHNHHPDILVRYNRVSLRITTHDAGGVTEKDLALGERIDFATSAR